jgi:hypothetical protein
MKLKYQAKKGNRFKKRFIGINIAKVGFWWSEYYKKPIIPDIDISEAKKGYVSNVPCSSVRKFRRLLKKYPELNGSVLLSRWEGCDVYSSKRDKREDV